MLKLGCAFEGMGLGLGLLTFDKGSKHTLPCNLTLGGQINIIDNNLGTFEFINSNSYGQERVAAVLVKDADVSVQSCRLLKIIMEIVFNLETTADEAGTIQMKGLSTLNFKCTQHFLHSGPAIVTEIEVVTTLPGVVVSARSDCCMHSGGCHPHAARR
jgi:hypothetical protein